ncbi:MAG: PHP domain-containing protein [Bacteroidales bacterium]|nr:PHP domain-containing protein [Bacteroidales bacterium]
MSYLKQFPKQLSLLNSYQAAKPLRALKVNNHIHTPCSFSAFGSMEEAVKMAGEEGVRILGINDFYVTDGYGEFIEKCRKYRLFPLLNVELIGISKEEQEAGIRVNDPSNPGRTYISGKGLAFPSILPASQQEKLNRVVLESNKQVEKMIGLLKAWLEFQRTGISISVEGIMKEHALHLLRERHVAKALRLKLEAASANDDSFYKLLERVYGGLPTEKKREDIAGIEEELRTRLLKAGSPAFVPEDEKAFLKLDEIMEIIRAAGGIPTYPMLLDGAGSGITPFESDRVNLLSVLKKWGFNSVELIPLRNRAEVLKEYAGYFYENGFVVSFGTEHNTTAMRPLTVSCKNGVALENSLLEISFNGAAYQAAHQYLTAQEGPAYRPLLRDQMEELGRAVLNHYFKTTE